MPAIAKKSENSGWKSRHLAKASKKKKRRKKISSTTTKMKNGCVCSAQAVNAPASVAAPKPWVLNPAFSSNLRPSAHKISSTCCCRVCSRFLPQCVNVFIIGVRRGAAISRREDDDEKIIKKKNRWNCHESHSFFPDLCTGQKGQKWFNPSEERASPNHIYWMQLSHVFSPTLSTCKPLHSAAQVPCWII